MTRQPARQSAFTLLELLVVMAIIGTMAAVLVPRMLPDSGDRLVRDESQRLLHLMRLAGEDAILRNQPIGVYFSRNDYHFMRRGSDGWHDIDDDELYRTRKLPEGVELELMVEGGPSRQGKDTPQVLFLSTGEITPMEIVLTFRDLERRFHISGNFYTALQLEVEDV
jgi:general secretion pathway protein H